MSTLAILMQQRLNGLCNSKSLPHPTSPRGVDATCPTQKNADFLFPARICTSGHLQGAYARASGTFTNRQKIIRIKIDVNGILPLLLPPADCIDQPTD